MACKFLGRLVSESNGIPIYQCFGGKAICTLIPTELKKGNGKPVQNCGDSCNAYQKIPETLENPSPVVRERAKFDFCYVTGTNRPNESRMIQTMIESARRVGVAEDFHVFSPTEVPGSVHHQFSESSSWKNHMAKVDFLLEMEHDFPEYRYYVWLDTDNYFVRDPGDFSELLRDEKCWVSMESSFKTPGIGHLEWYGLFLVDTPNKPKPEDITSPTIFQVYEKFGARECYNTNGGMFIVRKEHIKEFHSKAFHVFDRLHLLGFSNVPDEPPLAIVGDVMVSDPQKNVFETHKHIWVTDWNGYWADHKGQLPDGRPWHHQDWLTGQDLGLVNPAIVHNMRGKLLMSGPEWRWSAPPQMPRSTELVGDALFNILKECGVHTTEDCFCKTIQAQMNLWGIAGCEANRPFIINHLNEAAKPGSWLNWSAVAQAAKNAVLVGSRGYKSTKELLDEAIRRTSEGIA